MPTAAPYTRAPNRSKTSASAWSSPASSRAASSASVPLTARTVTQPVASDNADGKTRGDHSARNLAASVSGGDEGVGQWRDGELRRQVSGQVVPRGQGGGGVVGHLRLTRVVPHQDLKRQVERHQWLRGHHRRARGRIAEDHQHGFPQVKAHLTGLCRLVYHREYLDPPPGHQIVQPRDGVAYRPRADPG